MDRHAIRNACGPFADRKELHQRLSNLRAVLLYQNIDTNPPPVPQHSFLHPRIAIVDASRCEVVVCRSVDLPSQSKNTQGNV